MRQQGMHRFLPPLGRVSLECLATVHQDTALRAGSTRRPLLPPPVYRTSRALFQAQAVGPSGEGLQGSLGWIRGGSGTSRRGGALFPLATPSRMALQGCLLGAPVGRLRDCRLLARVPLHSTSSTRSASSSQARCCRRSQGKEGRGTEAQGDSRCFRTKHLMRTWQAPWGYSPICLPMQPRANQAWAQTRVGCPQARGLKVPCRLEAGQPPVRPPGHTRPGPSPCSSHCLHPDRQFLEWHSRRYPLPPIPALRLLRQVPTGQLQGVAPVYQGMWMQPEEALVLSLRSPRLRMQRPLTPTTPHLLLVCTTPLLPCRPPLPDGVMTLEAVPVQGRGRFSWGIRQKP